jgi:hypothetical protein
VLRLVQGGERRQQRRLGEIWDRCGSDLHQYSNPINGLFILIYRFILQLYALGQNFMLPVFQPLDTVALT